MGLNFYNYDGLQPKMSAGMIKEHECTYLFLACTLVHARLPISSYFPHPSHANFHTPNQK